MSALSYSNDPIAIVGVAGRTAGCDSPAELWELLMSGGTAFSAGPPEDRPATVGWPDDVPRRAAYLTGLADFDAELFGISPREAEVMDPQQRQLLEVVWRLLEDSGTPVESLAGRQVGVYVGGLWHDYEVLRTMLGLSVTQHSTVGNSLDILAARLSYFLRTRGPSLAIESSCSSSLVAVHLACGAISRGEIEQAIVGASNLVLAPQTSEGLALFGGLSPTGRCRPFSAGADGFVRGEGVMAVHLKPLGAAVRDGNHVYACIHASGVNNDGGGESLVTPDSSAQEELLREVYAALGPRTTDLAYVEAHGTGTRRGDPAEARAVGKVLGRPDRPLGIGSIKSSIGHLEPAAGLAGLLKLVLSMQHGVIPPTVDCMPLNPDIPFDELGLTVIAEPTSVASHPPMLMGVNSFGWGGTNAHVVIGRAPATSEPQRPPVDVPDVVALRLSAPNARALDEVVETWAQHLEHADQAALQRAADELTWHRTSLAERASVLLPSQSDSAELPGQLLRKAWATISADRASTSSVRLGRVQTQPSGPARVAFVFPGQGAQGLAMAAGMRGNPAFQARLEDCCEALAPLLDVDIRRVLLATNESDWLKRVDVVQPALWAMSISLAAAWEAAGVSPDIVLGHSQGEIAAATVAGILSLEDGARVVARRSRVLRSIAGRGRMLAVQLSPEQARATVSDFTGLIDLAVVNSPQSCVLSGDADAVLLLKELLEAEDVFCRLVNVDYASHSPHVDALSGRIHKELVGIAPREGTVPMFSTVDMREVEGPALTAAYWFRNLRSPVLLSDAVDQLLREGLTHAIELSPHPVLTAALAESASADAELTVLPTLHRDAAGVSDFLMSVESAWASGLAARPRDRADGERIRDEGTRYPFRRRVFWLDADQAAHVAALEPARLDRSRVVGRRTTTFPIGIDRLPWLRDHSLGDKPVLPGAVSLALALDPPQTAHQDGEFRRGGARLRDVRLLEPFILAADSRLLAVEFVTDNTGMSVRAFSEADGLAPRRCHISARHDDPQPILESDGPQSIPGFASTAPEPAAQEVEDFYAACDRRGVRYGHNFKVVRRIERQGDGVLVHLALPRRAPAFPSTIHPLLLDGVLQAALALDFSSPCVLPAAARLVSYQAEEPISELIVQAHRNEDATIDLIARSPGGLDRVEVRGLELVDLRAGQRTRPGLSLVMLTDSPAGEATASTSPHVAFLSASGQEARAAAFAGVLEADPPVVHIGLDSTFEHGVPLDVERIIAFVGPGQQDLLLGLLHMLVRRSTETQLWVVAAGAVPCSPSSEPRSSGIFGLVTVAQTEHPQLRVRLLDLEGELDRNAVRAWWQDAADLAVIRGAEYAPVIRRSESAGALETPPYGGVGGAPLFRVVARRPGDLSSVCCQVAETGDQLAPTEVRVRVEAASLNFIDVLKAVDAYPDDADLTGSLLGLDAAGVVTEVGSAVDTLSVGDSVVCCAPGALAAELVADARFVLPSPPGITKTEAAALPMVLATAWHALVDLAHTQAGEVVLIHSAAGGLGLAAVQVAQLLGARVVATAGTSAKRERLRALGVEACYDSRDLSWARELHGDFPDGVDVVINSLVGDHLALGVDALRTGGRFIEVGKRDIHDGSALPLHAFSRMLTFASVDIAGLMMRRPERFAALLNAAWSPVRSGALRPLPFEEFTFARAAEAFRRLASGEVVGKVVLTEPSSVAGRVMPRPGTVALRHGVHLITGGLGAMGLATAEHLAALGVSRIALLGRHGPSADSLARIEALRAQGAEVLVLGCDVGDRADLEQSLRVVRDTLGPLNAVHHAAGILADALIADTDGRSLERVARGKLGGALLLDELTRTDPVELFVLFSSCAALLGSPGQAAYAAANAGLDALAYRRRREGRHALSIMWPPVQGAGLGARSGGTDRLERMGWSTIEIAEVGPILENLVAVGHVCVAPMQVDLARWSELYPATAIRDSWRELGHLGQDPQPTTGGGLQALLGMGDDERLDKLIREVTRSAAAIMRVEESELDPKVPLRSVGLDSLMTLELRAALERLLGIELSPVLLWKHATPNAVAVALAELIASAAATGDRH